MIDTIKAGGELRHSRSYEASDSTGNELNHPSHAAMARYCGMMKSACVIGIRGGGVLCGHGMGSSMGEDEQGRLGTSVNSGSIRAVVVAAAVVVAVALECIARQQLPIERD